MVRRQSLAGAALEIIESAGPQSIEELAAELERTGATRSRDPVRSVLAAIRFDARFVQARDGRWFSLAKQLDGCVLLHRLEPFEQQNDVLLLRGSDWLLSAAIERCHWSSDFSDEPLLVSSVEEVFPLPRWETGDDELWSDSYRTVLMDDPDEAINFALANRWMKVAIGRPGWLQRFADCEYIAFNFGSGRVDIVGLADSDLDVERADAAATFIACFLRELSQDPGPSADEIYTVILTEAPELLTVPLPPLDELLAGGGFLLDDDRVEPWRRPLRGLKVVPDDHYYDHMADRMTATEAKARLLALLDRVAAGEEIEITRHGKSIARLVPAVGPSALNGSMVGIATSQVPDEDLFSTGVRWDAA